MGPIQKSPVGHPYPVLAGVSPPPPGNKPNVYSMHGVCKCLLIQKRRNSWLPINNTFFYSFTDNTRKLIEESTSKLNFREKCCCSVYHMLKWNSNRWNIMKEMYLINIPQQVFVRVLYIICHFKSHSRLKSSDLFITVSIDMRTNQSIFSLHGPYRVNPQIFSGP